jgi:hypothetical protein
MQHPQANQSGAMNMQQLQDTALNLVEAVCGIISMPVEIILRPQYGTRYFPVAVTFFSALMMILLPALLDLAIMATHLIPFSGGYSPIGLFGIGALARVYFLLSFIHGIRLWRRMIHMETEIHSRFEGPPLPFFRLVPGKKSFWFMRIVIEPAFVFLAATILTNILIFEPGLGTFLHVAALSLMMKNFIGWYREWQYLRELLDMRNTGPIIGRLMHDEATEDELSQIHLASFPHNVPPDLKQAALDRLAQAFSVKTTSEEK